MFTPALVPIPHVGGPVLTGMPTVLTGGMPQARTTDMCMCVPAIPDAIVKGSLTVLVGGLMAARIGDTCSHGGALITGWPTVIIGDAGAVGGGAGAAFQEKVLKDLEVLSKTPSGKILLDRLSAAGKTVRIVPTADKNGYCAPDGVFGSMKARFGIGTDSVVQYNPDFSFAAYDLAGNKIAGPPQVILGHELCHALANSEGNQRFGADPEPPESEPMIEEEEAQAIGTGSHSSDPPPNENSLRSDLGLPLRDNHGGDVDDEGPEPRNLR